jgi:signal transduction histidine kinase
MFQLTALPSYAVAALAVAGTLALQLFISSFAPDATPYLLFIFPVLFSAWFFGRDTGCVATALSAIVIFCFLTPAPLVILVDYPVELVTLILFIVEATIISFLAAAKKKQEEVLEQSVTARTKQLEATSERLRRTEALASLGVAVAKIVHEIARPLNSIFTSLQLQERHFASPNQKPDPATVSFVEGMRGEVIRLVNLVNELREFSRPFTLNLSPIDLATTVTKTCDLKKLLGLSPKPILIEHQFAGDLPQVMADGEKLNRVLINLCTNAVEAMPEGGKLMLRGYKLGTDVCLEIEDTGVGIPEGLNIFEPFTTSKNSGWGLGLSIVQQIILAHNGSIEYKTKPGNGTVFKVCLPAARS